MDNLAHDIIKILQIEGHTLVLLFNTGEVRRVNLLERIKLKASSKDSLYTRMLDRLYFAQVKLHKVHKTVYWPNGIELCPDVLYDSSEVVIPVPA